MTQSSSLEFGKLRSFLWPIHNYELKKLVPMLFMFFLILFNYTVLRDTKDTLIVSQCGAEAIPFLKVYGTVPLAILFMVIYSKLSNILSKPKLFYASIIPFLIFFGLFASLIYPNRAALAPDASADWLQAHLHTNFAGLVGMYRAWPFSLFYCMAELWGSVVLSLLFWGFANDITRVSEAKRFYNLFGLGGNCALVISGPLIMYFSKVATHLNLPDDAAFGYSLHYLMGMIVVSGFGIMGVYSWMQRYVLKDSRFYAPDEVKKKKDKPKLSLFQSFAYLAKSRYVLLLALVVLSYGVAINLIEVTWKGQLRELYPDKVDYNYFMGRFSTITGFASIFMMLFVGGNFIRMFGWGKAAVFTPLVLGATGALFFAFVLFNDSLGGIVALFGTTPLFLTVVMGTIQNVFSKSSKYSLFDPTKEMAYIPLDQEQKVKGKAAIDVVGARLGKSGGALVNQVLILLVGFSAIAPYVAAVLFVVLALWMYAAGSLNKRFVALTTAKEAPEALAKPAAEATT